MVRNNKINAEIFRVKLLDLPIHHSSFIVHGFLRNWLLFCLLLCTFQLIGQNTEAFKRPDVVYLKSGSIFRGQIEMYEIGKELKLRTSKNNVMVFKAKNIKKIVQEPTTAEKAAQLNKPENIKQTYAFRENGLHFSTMIGYIGGNNQFGNYTDAFNVHFQSIYQHNRLLGAGLGVGVDFYNVNLGSIIPIYGTIRGYLKAKNVSPYYQIAAGYGISVNGESSSFTDSSGGYYLAPELGFRFGGSAETNMTVGLGLQWQQATYTQDFGDTISKNEDEYTFRRFNFKIGILF